MGRKFNREIVRILLLIPLLVALGLLFMWQSKPHFEDSFTRYANLAMDSIADNTSSSASHGPYNKSVNSLNEATPNAFRSSESNDLFRFDPNTIDMTGLVRLGFSQKQAQGILNYRKAGAVFRSVADFGRCYTVSDAKFQQLLPYIAIGSTTSRGVPGSGTVDRTSLGVAEFDALSGDRSRGSLTANEGKVGGASSGEVLSDGERGVSGGKPSFSDYNPQETKAERYFTPPLVDLNSADSTELITVRGIGSLTAQRIIEYRNKIGGFARVEQLQEIQGMNERNYLSILQQIFVDSSGITKIDINFATPERLMGHPYIPSKVLNKLLKQRQLKGGWRDTGDLVKQNILSREEAERLAPYLYFSPFKARN